VDFVLIIFGAILAGLLQVFLILASTFTTLDNPQRVETVGQANTLLTVGLAVLAIGFAACAVRRPRPAAICAAAAILLGVGALAMLVGPFLLEPVDGGGAARQGLTVDGLAGLVLAAVIAAGPGLILLACVRVARRSLAAEARSQQALLDEFRGASPHTIVGSPTSSAGALPAEALPAPLVSTAPVIPTATEPGATPPRLGGMHATPAPMWPPGAPSSATARSPAHGASRAGPDAGPTRGSAAS
jgi:hypothetical protein